MLDRKRIVIFLGFAFGIAWAAGLAVYLTGGIVNSPEISPGSGLTLALALIAGVYMLAPSLANLFTRWITHEGMKDAWLRPNFKKNWQFWAAGWVMPAVFTILGAALFFLIFPGYFDPALTTISRLLQASGQPANINPWTVALIQTVQAVLIAPLVNGVATFGEEFGWRAYLQPKLMPLGPRKAMLVLGVIWGVWHWPVIAMGHNYGLSYPGYPWLGMLMMVLFCFLCGTLLGWITWRGGSVWPAVIGHAAINGIANLPALFVQGNPPSVVGPLPVGIIPLMVWAVPVVYLMLNPRLFNRPAIEEKAG